MILSSTMILPLGLREPSSKVVENVKKFYILGFESHHWSLECEDGKKSFPIMLCSGSKVVEERTHKPNLEGSNSSTGIRRA